MNFMSEDDVITILMYFRGIISSHGIKTQIVGYGSRHGYTEFPYLHTVNGSLIADYEEEDDTFCIYYSSTEGETIDLTDDTKIRELLKVRVLALKQHDDNNR